jgi:hypothetical protein
MTAFTICNTCEGMSPAFQSLDDEKFACRYCFEVSIELEQARSMYGERGDSVDSLVNFGILVHFELSGTCDNRKYRQDCSNGST